VDGVLDWYWLGVLLGLGVVAGAIGRETRRPVYGGVSLAALVAALVVAFLGLEWWGVLAFVGAGVLSWLALRRLSRSARLIASIGTFALAFVPALGYLLAVAAPAAGVRLGRRAGSRYAGLRVLAKD
jgi:hypothetical protein